MDLNYFYGMIHVCQIFTTIIVMCLAIYVASCMAERLINMGARIKEKIKKGEKKWKR